MVKENTFKDLAVGGGVAELVNTLREQNKFVIEANLKVVCVCLCVCAIQRVVGIIGTSYCHVFVGHLNS